MNKKILLLPWELQIIFQNTWKIHDKSIGKMPLQLYENSSCLSSEYIIPVAQSSILKIVYHNISRVWILRI